VLDSEESEESHEEWRDLRLLDGSNPYKKLVVMVRANAFVNKFLKKNSKKGLDKRLLKGFFNKNYDSHKQKKRMSRVLETGLERKMEVQTTQNRMLDLDKDVFEERKESLSFQDQNSFCEQLDW